MPHQAGPVRSRIGGLVAVVLILFPPVANGHWNFPAPPPPEEYGNILINRTSEKDKVKPAVFSHWIHRKKHTCRVCHFELEFNMKANTTGITEEANRSGQYCGACHGRNDLFGFEKQNCVKCHNGDVRSGSDRFTENRHFPEALYGNGIDWMQALEEKWITPAHHLSIPQPSNMSEGKELELESNWTGTPSAVFSHARHSKWHDCNDCHPGIFTIKKKATEHFEMIRNIQGDFCGVCHRTVAFPLTDCKRCHPRFRNPPWYPSPVSR